MRFCKPPQFRWNFPCLKVTSARVEVAASILADGDSLAVAAAAVPARTPAARPTAAAVAEVAAGVPAARCANAAVAAVAAAAYAPAARSAQGAGAADTGPSAAADTGLGAGAAGAGVAAARSCGGGRRWHWGAGGPLARGGCLARGSPGTSRGRGRRNA